MSRQIGQRWEAIARAWLKRRKLRIIDTNFLCRDGEIDLVAQDCKEIAFIEVKFRRGSRYGLGQEHVTAAKRKKIVRAANFFLQYHSYPPTQVFRFDVISIDQSSGRIRINWIKNAFWAD